MRPPLPDYKDYLKEAIRMSTTTPTSTRENEDTTTREDDDGLLMNSEELNSNAVASPEASILSSAHSETASSLLSSEKSGVNEGSFLSVSPSMLNSSLFEVLTTPSSSSPNSSPDHDNDHSVGVSNSVVGSSAKIDQPQMFDGNSNSKNNCKLFCNSKSNNSECEADGSAVTQTVQELRDDEALARAIQKIENEKEENVLSDGDDNIVPPTWHDRSAFESIGSRMYDDDRIIDDGEGGEGSPATTVTVVQEEDEKERVPSEESAAANNGGVLDAILEVGTIAAGVFGIALILATGLRSKQSQAAKSLRPCAHSCQHLRKQDATKRNGWLKTKS